MGGQKSEQQIISGSQGQERELEINEWERGK